MRFFRKALALLLVFCLTAALTCALGEETEKFSYSFFDTFDTVITLTGFAPSREAFDSTAARIYALYTYWHELCDAYHAYGESHNLHWLNLHAAEGPVEVEKDLFRLLQYAQELYFRYGGANIAMGSVLFLWHDARTAGDRLPEETALSEAAPHTDMSALILDEAACTVYYADPSLKLDLGCIAKGYATERAAEMLYELMPSFILNAGGNVRLGNPPRDGRNAWTVGIQNPDDPSAMSAKLHAADASIVTSGDYQRAYTVNGKSYHHIIDPVTLYPSEYCRSVTVICEDSGFADYFSTTLFTLPYESGRTLADSLGVQAVWILQNGTMLETDGLTLF